MAVRKSEIYSSLYEMCDNLRGGVDPSQYKNYILTLLFVKYISDKFKGNPYAGVIVPEVLLHIVYKILLVGIAGMGPILVKSLSNEGISAAVVRLPGVRRRRFVRL